MQPRDPAHHSHLSRTKPTFGKTRRLYTLYLPTLFLFALLSGYWLKSQLGIDFFAGDTLSKYFPFSTLVPNRVIANPRSGILFHDSFDSFSLFGNWNDLWMRENGRVTRTYDPQGVGYSRCLLVKSSSTESWSSTHKKYIQVQQGDTFKFTVSVQLQGEKLSAYAEVSVFDEKKNVLFWNYISEKNDLTGEWVTMESSFTIPEGISYIMFKISGAGVGEYRFDDITFSKI